jgi:Zn-dependent protease
VFGSNRDPYRASILYPGDPRRSRNAARAIVAYVNWEIVAGFVVLFAFFTFVLWTNNDVWRIPGTLGLVLVGWVFSLCLHEFAHAATAFIGGDRSESTASYLSFNPLKYVHPVLSIVLPVIFILLGFIALPGGAVYLNRGLVRSRVWQSAISAAGPLMNLLVLGLTAIPFLLGVTDTHPLLAGALGVLAFFEAAAVILNLIPIPGLDGYGILEPWLPYSWRDALAPFRGYGFLILVLLLFAIPAASEVYFTVVGHLLDTAHVDAYAVYVGFQAFQVLRIP